MTKPDEDRLIEAARRALQRAADDLDAPTRARLRQARYRALDALALPARGSWGYARGGVALAGIVVALSALLWLNAPPELRGARLPETALADLDLLATNDGPEFYVELEFYNWLEDPNAG